MFPLWLRLVARGTLAEGLAFPISYNILEALFVGSPGENILLLNASKNKPVRENNDAKRLSMLVSLPGCGMLVRCQ